MIVATCTFQLKLFYVYASKSSSTSNNGRVAAFRKKSGKIIFFSGSEILVNFFNQVKEFLNPFSESLKSQGILSPGFCKLFYFIFPHSQLEGNFVLKITFKPSLFLLINSHSHQSCMISTLQSGKSQENVGEICLFH